MNSSDRDKPADIRAEILSMCDKIAHMFPDNYNEISNRNDRHYIFAKFWIVRLPLGKWPMENYESAPDEHHKYVVRMHHNPRSLHTPHKIGIESLHCDGLVPSLLAVKNQLSFPELEAILKTIKMIDIVEK